MEAQNVLIKELNKDTSSYMTFEINRHACTQLRHLEEETFCLVEMNKAISYNLTFKVNQCACTQ